MFGCRDDLPRKKNEEFKFEFTHAGKSKTVGVLNIHDKRGRQSQAWGAIAVHDFKIVADHPVAKGLKIGDLFHDECWDFDQIAPGENGKIIAVGVRKKGVPVPVFVVGRHGKGRIVISGVAFGVAWRRENGKNVKLESPPKGNLGKVLVNSVNWMLN